MQTFLPSANWAECARILDDKRLGKQRVECKQIYKALNGDYASTGAWVNHPATKMWHGHKEALAAYGYVMCMEWRRRGFNDSLAEWFWKQSIPGVVHFPNWMFSSIALDVYASHRSNLLRKDPKHYGQFNWSEPDNLEYVWPV